MSITRAALETAVTNVVRSASTTVVTNPQLAQGINNALRKLSQDKPLRTNVALPNDTDHLYLLTDVVAGWTEGYQAERVLYLSSGRFKEIDPNNWQSYELAGVAKLKIHQVVCDDFPVVGSTSYYLEYSYPYDTSADPIPVSVYDEDALVALAASKVADQLAAEAADHKSPSFSADSVNYQEQIDKWLKISRHQMKIYKEHLAGNNSAECGAFGEWDLTHSFGQRMLFHGDRRH